MSIDLGYSEGDLHSELRNWWNNQVAAEDDPFADPRPPRTGTIFEVVPELDSLGVVSALVTIEKIVKMPIAPRIIKAGGYSSFEEMIGDLLPKVRALVLKKRGKEAA